MHDLIYKDNIIGYLEGCLVDSDTFWIESIKIQDTRNGYGTKIVNQLRENYNVFGDCILTDEARAFWNSLGADISFKNCTDSDLPSFYFNKKEVCK